MRLQFLPANQAWVFTYGTSLLRMGPGPMFHTHRSDAITAAADCGLTVATDGTVTVSSRTVATAA